MKNRQDTIQLKAGERIKIFSRSFSSVPMAYEFAAKPINGTELSGMIEIEKRQTLVSRPKQEIRLQRSNTVKASMWDTFVTIFVTAGCDMTITVPKRNLGSLRWVIWLVAAVIIAAAAMIIGMPQ